LARAFGAKVFATVSPDKKQIAEGFGAFPIDYRSISVEEYVSASTEGKGFDIVYDTVGGATLDASFAAVKRYTGHVVSCLGWESYSLAPLSFRAASYSGVFTLPPLITGEGRSHHGEILARAAASAEAGELRPFLNEQHFSINDIVDAHASCIGCCRKGRRRTHKLTPASPLFSVDCSSRDQMQFSFGDCPMNTRQASALTKRNPRPTDIR